MPLPQGFVLDQPIASQPKVPQGFVLDSQQPQYSAGRISTSTTQQTPLSEEELQGVMSPAARLIRQKTLAGQAMVGPETPPTVIGGTMQGIGTDIIRAFAQAAGHPEVFDQGAPKSNLEAVEQSGTDLLSQAFHPVNYLIPGAYGAVSKISPLLAKLGLAALAAPTIGQSAGVLSPGSGATGPERLKAGVEGGVAGLGTLPLIGELRSPTKVLPPSTPPPPPPREPLQLNQPRRFYGGSSASPVIDASQLSPNELTEAMRLAQANQTMQERQLADIASKKKYGGELPIIGSRKLSQQPLQVMLRGEQERQGELPQTPEPKPVEIVRPSEVPSKLKEVQGGQVSFSSPATAGGVPSARQSAIENIRPAVRTMDNKVYIGEKGDTHNDIITKNSLAPTMIDRRMFVDEKGNPISREELGKQGVPGEPSSVPGAHSTGLDKVQRDITSREQHPVFQEVKGLVFSKDMNQLRVKEQEIANRPGLGVAGSNTPDLLRLVRARMKELQNGKVDPELDAIRRTIIEQPTIEPEKQLGEAKQPKEAASTVEAPVQESQPKQLTFPDPRQVDIARFNELGQIMKSNEMGSEPFMSAWQEREKIKNKYGGMPPEYQGETPEVEREGTRLYGGVPFLDPKFYEPLIKDSKSLADKVVKTTSNLLENGKLTEAVSRKYDAIRGVSQRVADQLSNNIRGPLTRDFGKKNLDLAEQALSLVRESKEDKGRLQQDYNNRGDLKSLPKWQEKWSKAAEFALANWDKLVPYSKQYQAYTDQVLNRLSDVDRPVERRSGYVRHLPESKDNVTGFRRAREYETFFDRIKAGSDPKSLNSVELLKSTIYDAHRSYIQSKAFNDWMTKVKAPNGKPLAMGVENYEKVYRGGGRKPDVRPPAGYTEMAVGGQRIAVQDEFKGLIQRLTDTSIFDRRSLGRALQEYAGLAKHIQFAIDLVHLGRMARIEMAAKGGTGNLPLPTWKKGILTLDYTPQELEAKAKAGEIDQKDLPELLENRRINNKLVEGGFNVGHYADALRSNWVEKIPVSGQVQRFIFNVFTRGAMAEVGPMTYRLYKSQYPELSEEQVVGKVVHDLNYTFRNLGKQGPIKSASGDDMLRLIIAAPQWTIGTPMYEGQAIGGAVKGALTGKFNIQSRTVGTMIAAYVVANQIINYASTGHSTFENEKGHRLDAWVPTGKGTGYWVGPEAAALETVNRIEQVANKSETFLEGARNYIDPKLSAIGKAVATAATGHKYGLTGPLLEKKDQLKTTAEHLAVVPIAASAAMKEGQLVPQLMRTAGLEGTPSLSDRQKMYQAARLWMKDNKINVQEGQFPESKYLPLTDALRKGDLNKAKDAYEKLKGSVEDKLIRTYYKNYPNRGFTNSEEHEQAFRESLPPEQRAVYDRAIGENQKVKDEFFKMIGEREPASAEPKGKGKKQRKFKLFGE